MGLYNRETKLSTAILEHPQLIPVVNRLGIMLCVGDMSIGSICANAHIDPDFFLSMVNTFLDKDYFPVNSKGTFTLEKTVDYLRRTSEFYKRVQLPNVERHFNSLLQRSGGNNNLALLQKFFNSVRTRFDECYAYDNDTLFPSLLSGRVPGNASLSAEGHFEMEERLHDLLCFFVVHLRGEYDPNLCVAVVTALSSLDKDYRQNNRIRNRILTPLMEEMHNNGC